ncbi:MAG: hypothetical protein R2716_13235 [Microthrixaceae bacterium]
MVEATEGEPGADRHGELDELLVGEVLAQAVPQLVVDPMGIEREALCELGGQPGTAVEPL